MPKQDRPYKPEDFPWMYAFCELLPKHKTDFCKNNYVEQDTQDNRLD